MSKKYILASPNFSEGRNTEVVEKIVDTVRNFDGVTLVKYEPEGEFNRTVVTLIGEPEPLKDAIAALAKKCVELIDMRKHQGTHPRFGSLDVTPCWPFHNADLDDVVAFAKNLGEKIFEETKTPVFYVEAASSVEERKRLPFIRKGQYEGLKKLLLQIKDDPEFAEEYALRKPDLSVDGLLSETAGATAIAPMEHIAAAYNIFLETEDLDIAKKIANTVRSASGGFSTITAIGIKFEGRSGTVVSINVMDTTKTPLYRPFEMIKMEANRYGTRVTGSELVGSVTLDFLIDCFKYQLQLEGFEKEHIIETHLI